MFNLISLIIFGYLLGSFPTGFLICKAKGINIQKIGSGATGGTNVSRALGWGWGAFVGIIDVLKGLIPVYLAINFLIFDWQIVLVAITPILGHIFPVWLNFKGGKGVASAFGVLFMLLGWQAVLVLIFIQILVLISVKIVSFSSLTMASFIPVVALFFSNSLSFCIFGFVLFILVWWAHRENIQRLKEGKEPKFKLRKTTQ